MFDTHFAEDLDQLTTKFPNAQVMVLDYYDPFPTEVVTASNACGLFSNAAIANKYYSTGKSWYEAIKYVVTEPTQYAQDAANAQNLVDQDASYILSQLNGTINAVVLGAQAKNEDVTTVAPDGFADHSACSADSWLFTPQGRGPHRLQQALRHHHQPLDQLSATPDR